MFKFLKDKTNFDGMTTRRDFFKEEEGLGKKKREV